MCFNYLENIINDLIEATLSRAGVPSLADSIISKEMFKNKLKILQCLSKDCEGLHEIPFKEMIALNDDRNKIAHGHFEQNPFDGTYKVLSKNGVTAIDASTIREKTRIAERLSDKLRYNLAWFEFSAIEQSDS